jgi:alpha-mannosidase
MHRFAPYTLQNLEDTRQKIKNNIYNNVAPLNIKAWCSKEPLVFAEKKQGKEKSFTVGQSWGDLFDCAWFNFTGTIPQDCAGKHVVLIIDVNGELCVFDNEGTPIRGLTSVNCIWTTENVTPVKRVLQITPAAKGGEEINVWADGGCNDLLGTIHENGTIKEAFIATCENNTRDLFFDFEVLHDLLGVLPKDSIRYSQLLNSLNDVVILLRNFTPKNIQKARDILKPQLAKKNGDTALRITAIGHSHMDLAWLWPIRETIRKGARTFATALELMDRYPDYIFCASQPQLFQWMKDYYPGLYQKIKTKVKEGRIDPVGGMWVESDTNVPSGESLVRQVLYGKQFFKQEFGIEINNLFLPDVFGYSAAIPQILKKSDIDFFTTQKLSWNLLNDFPHHSFLWQGIDGSQVISHMLAEGTYNSASAPHSVIQIDENFKNKDVSEHALLLYGIGDGGGGPSAEHLERLDRMKNLNGISPVVQEKAELFFGNIKKEADKFPIWMGELYLERHQGTLTTHARNKWFNRKCEIAFKELEMISCWNNLLWGEAYPSEKLLVAWQEVLLYQFHDILPGSSIKRVYDECVPRYETIYQDMKNQLQTGLDKIAERIDTSKIENPFIVFNTLNWQREQWLKLENDWFKASVPSLGYVAVDSKKQTPPEHNIKANKDLLENDVIKIEFAENGAISSVWDKSAQRELLMPDSLGNVLAVYFDEGDAWDMPLDYAETNPRTMELVDAAAQIDGPQGFITQKYKLGYSTLEQKISIAQGSKRIDFVTKATWRETASMLRTSFPVDIHAEMATYEIQFGYVQRPTHNNTSWDLAKQEVPTQKWADLSESNYGIALLNDSKYGYKIKNNVIDLDLIRSAPFPGPVLVRDENVKPGEAHGGFTDQCDHTFTYSLFPHLDSFSESGVIQNAYELNNPLYQLKADIKKGELPAEQSFLKLDKSNIIVEAIKKAEDSDDIVIRMFEAYRAKTSTTLKFVWPLKKAFNVNLMEQHPEELAVNGNKVTVNFKPFEVKTVKVGF